MSTASKASSQAGNKDFKEVVELGGCEDADPLRQAESGNMENLPRFELPPFDEKMRRSLCEPV